MSVYTQAREALKPGCTLESHGEFLELLPLGPTLSNFDLIATRCGLGIGIFFFFFEHPQSDSNYTTKTCGIQTLCISTSPGHLVKYRGPALPCFSKSGSVFFISPPVIPTGRGAWWAAVHGVAKSRIRLSDFTFTFQFHALEKEMATHSSVLAWRILRTGEPGGLPSMGSHRVGHNWSDLAAAAAAVILIYALGVYLEPQSRR